MFESFFDLSDKIWDGFFAGQVQGEILDEVLAFFEPLIFLLPHSHNSLLIPGLISTAKHQIMTLKVEVLHGLKSDSTVTTSDNNIERFFMHEIYCLQRQLINLT